MSLSQTGRIQQAPASIKGENEEKSDLIVPSLFISAAAIVLGFIDPIYWRFGQQPALTIGLTLFGLALMWPGALLRRRILLYAGVAVLLGSIALEAITQPTQLSVPLVAVWPLRILLVLLVAFAWAFLMRPPRWLSRALVACAVPTVLVLAVWGGPATGATLFGWNFYVPVSNFTPYWLAIDSHDTLYATDASGDLIWVFDSTGAPQGTIRASRAPAVGTPGPGILPNGLVEEMNLANAGLAPSPTPVGGPAKLVLDFCGIAVDPHDNLYTVDTSDKSGPKILRFDKDGMITQRIDVPSDYGPTKGCIAVDNDHIYVASRYGKVYLMDHSGKIAQEVDLTYQPLGIAVSNKGELLITGPNILNKVEVSTGQVLTTTLPAPQGQLQIPYQAIAIEKSGDVLVSDWGSNTVLRVDPTTNKIVTTIGSQGYWPGQFKAMGGMALDKEGRIYVADWQHRVIERFTPDGQIDSVWWAARPVPEQQGVVDKD